MVSNCCRAFFLLCFKKIGRPLISLFPGVGVRNLVSCPQVGVPFFSFPRGGCQKLSFMPTSGRRRDQSLRTFSAFPRFVGVFGLLFQRPFRSRSFIDRSIDRLSRNKKDPVTQVVQSSANKEKKSKKNVQNSSPWLLGKWFTSRSCSDGVFGMRFLLSSLGSST